MKHYTKHELKIVKDLSLSDEEVAKQIGRSTMAVYCKRWDLKKSKKTDLKKSPIVVNKTKEETIKRIVLGNITIDISSQTMTINM